MMTSIAELFSLAWQHHQAGSFGQAEQVFRQIVQADPRHADAWCFLGVVCQAQGKLAEAEVNYRQAVKLWPGHHVAQNGLGIILAQTGRLDQAAAAFHQLTITHPQDADVFNNLGLVRGQQGQLDEAIACYQRAVKLRPSFAAAQKNLNLALEQMQAQSKTLADRIRADGQSAAATSHALNERATTLIEQGQFDEARVLLQRAVELEPAHADANINLANVFVRLERYDDAIVQYKKALQLRPDHFGSHYILGIALQDKGQLAEAEKHFRQAILLNPNFADTYNSLGLALIGQGRVDEAVACYHDALRLRPDYLAACINLGAALEQQEKLDEAIACCEYALRLDPRSAAACCNMGMALKRQGKLDAAMARFDQTVDLEPTYGAAHWNRATTWLLQGDFERGWVEYECRWMQPDFGNRHFIQPAWDGSSLEGKTILIYAEQGIGDTFQFVRYVRLVQQRGGHVVFQCPPKLLKLMGNLPEIDSLVVKDSPMSAFDVHAALLSLPGIFHTSLATVPAEVPYLYPKCELVEQWRKTMCEVRGSTFDVRKISSDIEHRTSNVAHSANSEGLTSNFAQGFKVGIAWQGNPEFREDRQRSMPLACFAPLARVPGVQLISLQKVAGTKQLRDPGVRLSVLDLADRLDEEVGPFMDTAALIKNLDLIISSDTAVPHLAGALGVPVWVALPTIPDWRWLLDREDSPWYPTMRLFRQCRYGHWDDVFERMADELKSFLATGSL
jgi:tetratricopeptide (TPR) repeat protein